MAGQAPGGGVTLHRQAILDELKLAGTGGLSRTELSKRVENRLGDEWFAPSFAIVLEDLMLNGIVCGDPSGLFLCGMTAAATSSTRRASVARADAALEPTPDAHALAIIDVIKEQGAPGAGLLELGGLVQVRLADRGVTFDELVYYRQLILLLARRIISSRPSANLVTITLNKAGEEMA